MLKKKVLELKSRLNFLQYMVNQYMISLRACRLTLSPKEIARLAVGHRLCGRVLELEAKLDSYNNGVRNISGFFDVLSSLSRSQAFPVAQLIEVGDIQKYQDTMLPFFGKLSIMDPRQLCFIPRRLNQYEHLFDDELQKQIEQLGEWGISWKLRTPPSERFNLLDWWEHAAEFYNLQVLDREAAILLTQPITSFVADSSFRALKGLLTPD